MADENVTTEKEWTIMVYMAGDNNLNTEMVYALEQLKEVAKDNGKINLYVYFDGISSAVPTLYCDFSEFCESSDPNCPVNFYQSYKIKNKLIDVDDNFNENSAAVNNIINFVDWCVKKDTVEQIKEKKYAFIFSGHSFGFLNWGLFRDEKADYYMTHAKLKYMFERITSTEEDLKIKAEADEDKHKREYGKPWSDKRRKERTTVILGKSLDLLGFDSCVMSTLELGSQFRKFAKTMVASEGSIPTAGWNYAQILLGRIRKYPKSEGKAIAVSFVDKFIKQQNKFALADISVDISAWDLTRLPELEDHFADLVTNLLECFRYKKSVIYNQMKRLLTYAHWQCQTYMFEQHIDLGDFCQILILEIDLLKQEVAAADISPIINVSQSCKKVIDSISDCVLITGFSGSDFQFSKGISLFFPWSLASYDSARNDYEKLSFIKKNYSGIKWNEFLETYLSDISLRQSIPLTQIDENGNLISSSVIYESYANMDDSNAMPSDTSEEDGRQPPNSGRQPPNSGRQPPNSGRQPPNSGRMLGDMNIFLSRFMKLKNFQFNWNRTGFTSKHVIFKPTRTSDMPSQDIQYPDGTIVVDIPKPRNILKQIEVTLFKLYEVGKTYSENIEEYIELLKEIFQNTDEPTIVKILGDLNNSNLLNSQEFNEEEFRNNLVDAFSKAIVSIRDTKLKEEIWGNFDKINLK